MMPGCGCRGHNPGYGAGERPPMPPGAPAPNPAKISAHGRWAAAGSRLTCARSGGQVPHRPFPRTRPPRRSCHTHRPDGPLPRGDFCGTLFVALRGGRGGFRLVNRESMANTLSPPPVTDLLAFAAGAGHPDFPCLSRNHAPPSCAPCADFSPWLMERVRQGDEEAVGDYLWRLREANPGLGEPLEQLLTHYNLLAGRILTVPFERHLVGGDTQAYLDLRVALALLAVHEGFSGFIMTGEAADFMAATMAPHPLELVGAAELVCARNEFVRE